VLYFTNPVIACFSGRGYTCSHIISTFDEDFSVARQLFLLLFLCVLCVSVVNLSAQDDGLNLPTELYVLQNSGVVERYGIGAAGITIITPDDEFVLDFAIAPDDNTLAYRTEQGLWLKAMFGTESTLVEPDTASLPFMRGRGETLLWTADAEALAYTTLFGARVYFPQSQTFVNIVQANVVSLLWSPNNTYLTVEAQNPDPNAQSNFWWIYRRENTTFTLVSAIPSSMGVSWLDETRIVFAPETGGLYTMDMSAGNAQTELLDTSTVYRLPYVREGGIITVFATSSEEVTPEPGTSGVVGRLLSVIDGEASEVGSAPVGLDRVQWAPRGDLLVAFRGGALALVNPANGLAFALPVTSAVAYGWGPLPPRSVRTLELPTDGYFLSDFATGIPQIWRLPSDGSPAYPFTQSENDITEFAVSPDGRQVVYVSGGALWLQAVDPEATASELATLEARENIRPTFSPSGDQIAYSDGGIWLVSTDGGAEEVLDGDYVQPQFAPNVNALMANQLNAGLGVFDIEAGSFTVFSDTHIGFWLRDGRIASVENGGINIYELSTLPTPSEFVSFPGGAVAGNIIEASRNSLRMVLIAPALQPAQIAEFELGGSGITPIAQVGYLVAPRLSPDGSFVAGYRYLRTDSFGYTRGPLLFVDVETGERVTLSSPPEAWAFRWGT
jgi:hypothetical protein